MSTSKGYSNKNKSAAKWSARKLAYSQMTNKQRAGYHIVIVGWIKKHQKFQCDDIPFLIDMGIPANRIIACGIGQAWIGRYISASEWAHITYGTIICPEPMIQYAVAWAQERYDIGSVNVDLCATLMNTLPVLRPIVDLVGRSSVILFTHRYGRDGRIILNKNDPKEVKDRRRLNEIKRQIGYLPDLRKQYVSKTDNSVGSNMCVNVFKRRYYCRKCGQLGSHPSTHKKVCTA